MYLALFCCFLISFVYFTSSAMGLFTDIRKRLVATPSNSGLDGRGERSTSGNVSRGKSTSRPAQPRRPQGLDAGSESQDSGVVILHKDSTLTLSSVPDYQCPNCAATAASASRANIHAKPRPSMEAMQAYPTGRPLVSAHSGHPHDQPRITDAGHDLSRPGTGYSNHSVLLPMQNQHQHHHSHQNQQQDRGFSQRPVSWGRRATTENVDPGVPSGYTRPVTPPYSVTSEQTGWNSGQPYNNMGGHPPAPASHDGHSSQRPVSWRRATDQRQPASYAGTAPSSRAPSEAGSNHPRNASKNMESSAYEAGYRDGMSRDLVQSRSIINANLPSQPSQDCEPTPKGGKFVVCF